MDMELPYPYAVADAEIHALNPEGGLADFKCPCCYRAAHMAPHGMEHAFVNGRPVLRIRSLNCPVSGYTFALREGTVYMSLDNAERHGLFANNLSPGAVAAHAR